MINLLPKLDKKIFGHSVWYIIPGDGYMYGPTNSLLLLLWQMFTEWKHDKHLVG